MEYNMSFIDISIHYTVMMSFMIAGGFFQSYTLMTIGFVFYIAALSGWSPVFYFLGINHCKGEEWN